MTLLEIDALSLDYGKTQALRGIGLRMEAGESLGLVGESGSGKTTLALALLGLLPQNARIVAGQVRFAGMDLASLRLADLRKLRWVDLAYVPQGAMNALDPVRDLAHQFDITWRAHRTDRLERRAAELFRRVGLEERWLGNFPHEYSGGMRQRATIALSMLFTPRLLVADEPTTGLDVLVQHQLLDLLREAKSERGMALIFVSHDIAVVSELCDRIAVLYAGQLVETGATKDVLARPAHPYTMGLRRAVPDIRDPMRRTISIEGAPPALDPPPGGCAFAKRCPFAQPRCESRAPPAEHVDGRVVLCHRAAERDALWSAAQAEETWIRDT